jgi:hypothetical protein
MRSRGARWVGAFLLTLAGLPACGPGWYTISVNSASSKLEEARALGADRLAPYEYYYAKAHLDKAKLEAGEANYSDAAQLSETAEDYATRAVRISQSARKAGISP